MKHLHLRVLALALAVIGLLGAVSLSPALTKVAQAQSSLEQAQQGVTAAGGSSGGLTLDKIVRNVVNILSWVVGVAAVFMLVIAGLKYITSSGDAGGIQSAKNTVIYAIVGLLIAIFAQVIIRFVLKKATTGAGDSGGDDGGDENTEEQSTLILTILFS